MQHFAAVHCALHYCVRNGQIPHSTLHFTSSSPLLHTDTHTSNEDKVISNASATAYLVSGSWLHCCSGAVTSSLRWPSHSTLQNQLPMGAPGMLGKRMRSVNHTLTTSANHPRFHCPALIIFRWKNGTLFLAVNRKTTGTTIRPIYSVTHL